METKKSLLVTAMAVTAFVLIDACSKSSNGYTTPTPPAAPTGIMLSTSATLGSYLADNQNHALYFSQMMPTGRTAAPVAAQLYGRHLISIS